MTTTRRPDDLRALTPGEERRRPAVVALRDRVPTVDQLFAFMRDAELRFETLLLRIEERTYGARGEQVTATDVAIRHPGFARVTTSEPSGGVGKNFDVWISDGEIVRTYSRLHKLGTRRPVRPRVRGLDDAEFPERSRVYEPLTALPMETLPETFVHPAGYCQNVLATGRTWISGTDVIRDREVVVVQCDHPRVTELAADRPDFHIEVAVDRFEGVIVRLVESIAGEVTRDAEAVTFRPNAPLPAGTFEFEFPAGTTLLY